jgi:hypothetical protein
VRKKTLNKKTLNSNFIVLTSKAEVFLFLDERAGQLAKELFLTLAES